MSVIIEGIIYLADVSICISDNLPHLILLFSYWLYTAHKKFMNGFAWRGFDNCGAVISTGRCQKTLVCKSAK